MSSDWNWGGQEETQCTVVPRVQAIAVYTNHDGEIVIRQEDATEHGDALVILPTSAVGDLILALQRELSEPFTPG